MPFAIEMWHFLVTATWSCYSFLQGSLHYLFGGLTMQMYGKFDGFPLNSALFGLVI